MPERLDRREDVVVLRVVHRTLAVRAMLVLLLALGALSSAEDWGTTAAPRHEAVALATAHPHAYVGTPASHRIVGTGAPVAAVPLPPLAAAADVRGPARTPAEAPLGRGSRDRSPPSHP